jgi:hypothetical protein
MDSRSLYAVAAAATLVLAACSEREPESTTGPNLAPTATDPCGFSNSLVTGYFPSSRQSFMLSVKQSMANSVQVSQKRILGFQIMDSIGSVSRNTAFSTSPAAGAELTVAIIGCIFPDNTFSYPDLTNGLSDFTKALNSAAGGAYYVRGGGGSNLGRGATILGTTTPASASGNLSGIAPFAGSSSANWTTMLSGNGTSVGQGVLFYGYNVNAATPGASVLYEWATIPSELTFSPVAVVSVCDENPSNPVVHEEDVGVLFSVTSPICDTQRSLTMIQGWGPKALAARLGRVLADALTPAPLQATTLAFTSGGGTTSKLPKSKFGKKSLTAVNANWVNDPADPGLTWNGTSSSYTRPVSAAVSADVGGSDVDAAVRFCAYLSGTNNNGTPTALRTDLPQPEPECTTPPNGDPKALSVLTTRLTDETSIADFGNVWVTKTGTLTITLMVSSGTNVTASSLTSVLNVKPALKK